MRHVRLAVIGCGFIGKMHLEAAAKREGVELAAVADLNERVARETARRFDIATVHTDANAVLHDPQVDAVVLAIPTVGRAPLALRALQAGKHVLLEKPPATNAEEIYRLLEARGDLVAACCASRYRFTALASVVTQFVASGTLGALRLVRARNVGSAGPAPQTPPPAWRVSRALNGGGIVANWGTYDLDFLLGVTGWSLQPRRILAQTWPVAAHLAARVAPGSDAESHGIALIKCDRGIVLSLERGEFTAAVAENTCEIIGTRGALRMSMTPVPGWAVTYTRSEADTGTHTEELWRAQANDPVMTGTPVEDFVEAIQQGCPPRTSLTQALVVQTILDGIYASSATGEAVDVSGRRRQPAARQVGQSRSRPLVEAGS